MNAPIVIAAGGTGGHFFPAEALAAELQSRGRVVVLMTDARSGGQNSAVFTQSERFVLRGAGIAGRGAAKAVKAAASLAAGTLQARGILHQLRPSAIVGFGGYPTVAPVLATRLLSRRPRVVLHEQNAVLGRANHAMVRWSDAVALSFEHTSRVPASAHSMVTGNPVRPAIVALAASPFALPHSVFHLLVLGGSLGARVFSDIVPEAIALLPADLAARLRITQQCRAEDIDRVRAVYDARGIHAELAPFFADVAGLLQGAQLVIARAGASTVAELAAIGRPSILVPLPSAIDDHQSANANALADAGGAWVMDQPAFLAADLAAMLAALIASPTQLAPLAAAAAGFGRIDATQRLADLVEQTITSKEIEA